MYGIAPLIVLRFGLVPLACAIFTIDMLANVPFSADLSTWYMPTSISALLSVVAIAGWGFYTLWAENRYLRKRRSKRLKQSGVLWIVSLKAFQTFRVACGLSPVWGAFRKYFWPSL